MVGFPTPIIFRSQKSAGDYHDEITAEHFVEWFASKLLPNVQPNCLIVVDNASYHSRRSEPCLSKAGRRSGCRSDFRPKVSSFPRKGSKQWCSESSKSKIPQLDMLLMTRRLMQVTDFSLVGDPHNEHYLGFF